MKRILSFFLALTLMLPLAACAAPVSRPGTSTDSPVTPELQGTVVFADPVLEAMVRGTIGKPEGDITAADAAAVTRLDMSSEWERYASGWTPIKELGGLEYFTSLESLDLSYHAITDITPLAGLSKLTVLALGGNPIADITPLAGLTSLRMLVLSGCTAQDYSPLARLTGIEYLRLDGSTITDTAPLMSLTSLKQLYLEGCELDYTPLTDIYSNLVDRDFTIATALAEYGFIMDGAQAIFDGEQVSVRLNHDEWGYPGEDSMQNCVRTVFGANEYKVDIGYYPAHDTYVVLAFKDGGFVLNYLYFPSDGSFSIGLDGSRESAEGHVRAIFTDADGDVLLAPIDFHTAALEDAVGMTATELFELPFEQTNEAVNAPPAASATEGTLSLLGFGFDDAGTCGVYEQREPHYISVAIARPEWGEFNEDWNIEFMDTDIKGYSLRITYHAKDGRYHISVDKDGESCAYDYYPATDDKGWEEPDFDTVHSMFNDAFGTKEKELYYAPLEYFEQFVREHFGMSIDELYAAPKQ